MGACDGGFSCAYMNNMSFRNATTPVPPETNPRSVFERLYGTLDTDPDPKVRERLKQNRQSMLDFISEDTQQLVGTLGASIAARSTNISPRFERLSSGSRAWKTKTRS